MSREPRTLCISTCPLTDSLFVVRLVAPYVLDTLVVVMRFFQRHPLSEGLFRTTRGAIVELVGWFWAFLVARIPVLGRKPAKSVQVGE